MSSSGIVGGAFRSYFFLQTTLLILILLFGLGYLENGGGLDRVSGSVWGFVGDVGGCLVRGEGV